MAVLTNKVLTKSTVFDTTRSFGPYLALDEDEFRFDTSMRDVPIWLGHVPSAMCGIVQFLESWDGRWTDELELVNLAFHSLVLRCKDRFCGQTDLCSENDGDVELRPAAVIYQYISLSMLDQYETTHRQIADSIETEFDQLIEQHGQLFNSHFVDGPNFKFGFELKNVEAFEAFHFALQKVGIQNKRIWDHFDYPQYWPEQPAGENRCMFALNLAYRGEYLDLFWQRLKLAIENFQSDDFTTQSVQLDSIPNHQTLIEFHQAFQYAKCFAKMPDEYDPVKSLQSELSDRFDGLAATLVDQTNYSQFRDRILAMQIEVYEPTRRTPAGEFDMLFDSENPLAIVVCKQDQIVAMVFAGRLSLFRDLHGGINSDPFIDDPHVCYSMALTVADGYRGGVGRLMKQALAMLAIERGVTAIHGRNRDRLAAGMWAINLSLGSYQLQRLADDYQDDEQFRDCIYYRCPLRWQNQLTLEQLQSLPIRRLMEGRIARVRGF